MIEGRSLHTTAVYQSLILHPHDDQQALAQAHQILDIAACWRPPPGLTLLITDDVGTSISRLEHRDHMRCTPEQRRMHERADWLFGQLARAAPAAMKVIDRGHLDREEAITQMLAAVEGAYARAGQLKGQERIT